MFKNPCISREYTPQKGHAAAMTDKKGPSVTILTRKTKGSNRAKTPASSSIKANHSERPRATASAARAAASRTGAG